MQPAQAASVPGTRFRLAAVAETGSTNVDLAAWVRDGLRPDYALRTDHQTAGRGRRDRTWEAPPGSGLMMSIALAEEAEQGRTGAALASAVGLAAWRSCRALGADVSMKWPNDLIGPVGADGTPPKLSGLLGELVALPSGNVAVVGIGVNLRSVPDRAAALGRAVCVLDELCDARPSADEFGRSLLRELESVLSSLETDGPAWLAAEMTAASGLIGRRVDVATDTGSVAGEVLAIDDEGRLVVQTADGVVELTVGDVASVRPV